MIDIVNFVDQTEDMLDGMDNEIDKSKFSIIFKFPLRHLKNMDIRIIFI